MTKTTQTFNHFSLYTVFLFFLHFLFFSHANSQLNDQEQTILLKLNRHWENPPVLSHWSPLNSSHYCDWPEITCTNGSLTELRLPNKNITGTFPPFICDLKNLTLFDLSNNNIVNEFPKALYNCSKLEDLDLSQNYFNGPIPLDIHRLSRLRRLNLGANSFSGKIPTGVSFWKNLVIFEASNNLFTGTIPQELTALAHLTTLLLDQNQLSGSLPSNIISWKSLNTLNLSRNKISGHIPEKLAYLATLTELDLSENQLSGQIPSQLGLLKLTSLNLSSNHLTGKIPTQFENNAYARSFLNNPTLCASKSSLNIDICNSEPLKSSKIPSIYLALIIGLVMTVAVCLFATYLVIRIYKKQKELESRWRLSSFHRLNFTESEILSGLTEKNLIGTGGSGKVYRVVVNPPHNFVAVKKIKNNRNAEQIDKEFLAEVKILGSIQHSNIVKLLCCISTHDSKLLVYEYAENLSLDQWLHRNRRASTTSSLDRHVVLDWPTRLKIAVGAAEGLCYMHHCCCPPIVHRDVKSSNILLDSEFNGKIADFGLAKMLPVYQEHATMSTVAGTPGHIDPEYYHTRQVNVKTDVYSFGVVLLELATGRKPFGGEGYLAHSARLHISENKPIVDALDERIKAPCYLDQMTCVFKLGIDCTHRKPSERRSMKEVVQILRDCNQPLVCGDSGETNSFHSASSILRNSNPEQVPENDYL